MDHDDLFYNLALQKLPGIGSILSKRLIEHFGSASNVFRADSKALLKIPGLGDVLLKGFSDQAIFKMAEKEVAAMVKNNISVSYFEDATYPRLLKECVDGPTLLFSNKPIDWNNDKIINIVGTRQATSMGIAFCEKLIADLKDFNPIIVSGLAYGIDITAHLSALENDLQTVAILGHGLNQVYPSEHEKYVEKINEKGGLVSEFWMSDGIDRENFIKRNRIVAGVCSATIVIESGLRGGSMNTVRFANDYNRDVFAVPGRVTDSMSKGCNELIKTHRAQLLSSAKDIVAALNWEQQKKKNIQPELFLELTDEERLVFDFLKQAQKELLDLIAIGCQLPVYKVSTILLNLELKGLIRPLPGKWFEII